MTNEIKICKLGLEQTTKDGAYYAKVNDKNIGVNDRGFWDTPELAQAAAEKYIAQCEQQTETPQWPTVENKLMHTRMVE